MYRRLESWSWSRRCVRLAAHLDLVTPDSDRFDEEPR
jgi:hypothetical protein